MIIIVQRAAAITSETYTPIIYLHDDIGMITAVCIMIDRSQKLVEWDFSFPLTGFDKGVNDDE